MSYRWRFRRMRRAGEEGNSQVCRLRDCGGGDVVLSITALDRKEPSASWLRRLLHLELMYRAELHRLERAAAVKKLLPSDLFCIHAAEFRGRSSRDAVWGPSPSNFFSYKTVHLVSVEYSNLMVEKEGIAIMGCMGRELIVLRGL
jgi:hypothetical protein